MTEIKNLHHHCTVERRRFTRHTKMNLFTGVWRVVREEWIVESCGVPLFDAAQKISGVCDSCERGWTHIDNFPTDKGKATLARGLS